MFINLNLLKMKKLKLKMKELTNPSVLTHHQLKNVMGGSEPVGSQLLSTCKTHCPTTGIIVEATDCKGTCTAYTDRVECGETPAWSVYC